MKISGHSFIHNALEGGYPIVEAIRAVEPYVDEMVVVDMESTDGTRDVLEKLGVRIIDGGWIPGSAGECLAVAHAMNDLCDGDIILSFEMDEVYDPVVVQCIVSHLLNGIKNIGVWRIQLEQNFQRCRWYPHFVHRVFPKGSVKKVGHSTNRVDDVDLVIDPVVGFLWDLTNIFRDNWMNRVENQAELWGEEPKYRMVDEHSSTGMFEITKERAEYMLNDPRWTWKTTPYRIPNILLPLVGIVKYEARI